jgi:LuxR family maltose regulon positive regulatory protein
MEQKDPRGDLEYAHQEVSHDLLSTKLTPPRLHTQYVPRPYLLERLDQGLARKLTLISAPAGFGKTTLVSEWVAHHREAHDLPALAWVALDAGDNDPVRFWRYVLNASRAFDEGISGSALELLNSSSLPPYQAFLTLFINGMAQLASQAVLVLEDFHAITAAQIHETMTFFINHLPPTLHVILMTRADPPLPLARLRARNELNELRAEDLRFSLQETIAFLEQEISFSLSAEMIKRLAERTEGWAAGLRLVSLALQKQGGEEKARRFLDTFTGSHRPVMDYFVADVLSTQPEPLQQFLLETSVLSRLTASLCDAVTGRNDSALILEQLERENLFLVTLDAAQQWYRFHALFAEAMQRTAQQRIGETRLCELSYEASFWYEAHGMLAEAVEAALFSQEFSRAAGLIERLIAPELVKNEYYTLRRWIEHLPKEVLGEHPEICMTYAVAIFFTTGRPVPIPFENIHRLLQAAEEHWQAVENQPRLGDVMAFRALLAWQQRDLQGTFSSARRSLQLLPENAAWRSSSLIFAGMEELYTGKLNAARQTFLQARDLSAAERNFYSTSISVLNLGEVYARQGALHQAAHHYRQVLVEIERGPMYSEDLLVRRGHSSAGLGALSLEWNDLEAAQQQASQAREIAELVGDENVLVRSVVTLARLRHIQGDHADAQHMLIELGPQIKNPLLLREIEAQHAWLALMAGDLITPQRWRDNLPERGDPLSYNQQEMEALVAARLLIAQGKPEQALQLLEVWLLEARDQTRMMSVIAIQVLSALARADLKEMRSARQALVEALELAQPEAYQRIFLDEGQSIAALLQATLPEIEDKSPAAYVRALQYTLAQEQAAQADLPGSSLDLIEPLSEQERRILRLLSAGFSNPEIAEELVISVNTVKTHVKNIYGKLGVNSREQVRQAALHLKPH